MKLEVGSIVNYDFLSARYDEYVLQILGVQSGEGDFLKLGSPDEDKNDQFKIMKLMPSIREYEKLRDKLYLFSIGGTYDFIEAKVLNFADEIVVMEDVPATIRRAIQNAVRETRILGLMLRQEHRNQELHGHPKIDERGWIDRDQDIPHEELQEVCDTIEDIVAYFPPEIGTTMTQIQKSLSVMGKGDENKGFLKSLL